MMFMKYFQDATPSTIPTWAHACQWFYGEFKPDDYRTFSVDFDLEDTRQVYEKLYYMKPPWKTESLFWDKLAKRRMALKKL